MSKLAKWIWKKKFALTLLCWAGGTGLAFHVAATLPQYTAFVGTLSAMFMAADVADKRLNGGSYSGES